MKKVLKKLLKEAALKDDVNLRDYQKRAVNKLLDNNSLVVAHGTGTGKTLTSIAAMEKLKEKSPGQTLVVVPASLKTNFEKEGINKFTDSSVQVIDSGSEEVDPNADYVIVSNSLFSKDPEKYSANSNSMVVDEAHNARNQNTNLYKAIKEVSPNMENKAFLTASPMNNAPGDVASLINLIEGEDKYNQTEFNKKYVKPETKKFGPLSFIGLGKKQTVGERFDPDDEVREYLQNYFDYERGDQDLPEVEEEKVRVPMTKEQMKAYKYAWNDLPGPVRKAVKRDIVPDKRDSVSFFGSIANARVASNNPGAILKGDKGHEISAKAQRLLEDLKDDDSEFGSMIYSNYNQHGADIIQDALKSKGVSSSRISGGMRKKDKDEQIENFKKNKTKAFVTSPTGKEGISLPNVDKEFIFDPNWNPEVTKQAIGRGVRANSKADKVNIKKYLAVEPEKKFLSSIRKPNRSVEEWIDSVAEKKKALQSQVYDQMGGNMKKQAMIDLGMEKLAKGGIK
jgi:superfamily II DNA or RNA helicase